MGWVVYVRPVKVPAAADNFFGNSYNKYKAIEIFVAVNNSFKVMGTCECRAITVTRFMQPTPILTLSSSKSVLGLNLFRPTHMYIGHGYICA